MLKAISNLFDVPKQLISKAESFLHTSNSAIKVWLSKPYCEPSAQQVEREIRTATGDSETLLITPAGDNLFRSEESSFVTDAV
jgi:hypothetical protein